MVVAWLLAAAGVHTPRAVGATGAGLSGQPTAHPVPTAAPTAGGAAVVLLTLGGVWCLCGAKVLKAHSDPLLSRFAVHL